MAAVAQQAEVTDKKYRHHVELSVGEFFLWNIAGYSAFAVPQQPIQDAYQRWETQLPINPSWAHDAMSVPPINVGYFYQVLDWLQVGGELSTATKAALRTDVRDDRTTAYFAQTNLYIAGGIRFNYYHKNILDLYSGLTLGASVQFLHTESNPLYETEGFVAWHLTALGLRFGKQVYGVVEVGYGYKGLLTLGIGTRF